MKTLVTAALGISLAFVPAISCFAQDETHKEETKVKEKKGKYKETTTVTDTNSDGSSHKETTKMKSKKGKTSVTTETKDHS